MLYSSAKTAAASSQEPFVLFILAVGTKMAGTPDRFGGTKRSKSFAEGGRTEDWSADCHGSLRFLGSDACSAESEEAQGRVHLGRRRTLAALSAV